MICTLSGTASEYSLLQSATIGVVRETPQYQQPTASLTQLVDRLGSTPESLTLFIMNKERVARVRVRRGEEETRSQQGPVVPAAVVCFNQVMYYGSSKAKGVDPQGSIVSECRSPLRYSVRRVARGAAAMREQLEKVNEHDERDEAESGFVNGLTVVIAAIGFDGERNSHFVVLDRDTVLVVTDFMITNFGKRRPMRKGPPATNAGYGAKPDTRRSESLTDLGRRRTLRGTKMRRR